MTDYVVTVAHSVPPAVAAWIAEQSQERGVSKSRVVSEALTAAMEREPDGDQASGENEEAA